MVPALVIVADLIAIGAAGGASSRCFRNDQRGLHYGASTTGASFDGYYSVIKAFFFVEHRADLLLHGVQHLSRAPRVSARRPRGRWWPARVVILIIQKRGPWPVSSELMIDLQGVRKPLRRSRSSLDGVDFIVRRARPWRCWGRPAPASRCLLKHIIGLIHPTPATSWWTVSTSTGSTGTISRRSGPGSGMCSRNGALFDSMNVRENIRLGICDQKLFKDNDYVEERVGDCLRLVNLQASVAKKFPAELFGRHAEAGGDRAPIAGKPK